MSKADYEKEFKALCRARCKINLAQAGRRKENARKFVELTEEIDNLLDNYLLHRLVVA